MKIKVSEATERQLDWMVAKCLASVHKDAALNGTVMHGWWISGLFVDPNYWISLDEFSPTTSWSQGKPILEREQISIKEQQPEWVAYIAICDGLTDRVLHGPTPLIAAMRCFVASRLGEIVEVPDALS